MNQETYLHIREKHRTFVLTDNLSFTLNISRYTHLPYKSSNENSSSVHFPQYQNTSTFHRHTQAHHSPLSSLFTLRTVYKGLFLHAHAGHRQTQARRRSLASPTLSLATPAFQKNKRLKVITVLKHFHQKSNLILGSLRSSVESLHQFRGFQAETLCCVWDIFQLL